MTNLKTASVALELHEIGIETDWGEPEMQHWTQTELKSAMEWALSQQKANRQPERPDCVTRLLNGGWKDDARMRADDIAGQKRMF